MDRIRGTFTIVFIYVAFRWFLDLFTKNLGGLALFLIIGGLLAPVIWVFDRPYMGKVSPDMIETHAYVDAPNWGFATVTNKTGHVIERVDITCGGKQFVLFEDIQPNESRSKRFYSYALNTRGPLSCEIDKIRS